MQKPHEPLHVRLQQTRLNRGYSRPELSRRTVRLGYEGVTDDAILNLENPDRKKRQGRPPKPTRPNDETLRALGDALNATSDELPEYHLARARALFDERVIGLDRALVNLSRLNVEDVEAAARLAAKAPVEALEQALRTDQRTPPGRDAFPRSNQGS